LKSTSGIISIITNYKSIVSNLNFFKQIYKPIFRFCVNRHKNTINLNNTMILRCAVCNILISNKVVQIQNLSILTEDDGKDHIQKGFYRIATAEDDVIRDEGEFILNIADVINTRYHEQANRLCGCCGKDGLGGINIVCKNGHEIGTECSDCWMPHYIHIPGDKVELIEEND
jgi:hypothetical protein